MTEQLRQDFDTVRTFVLEHVRDMLKEPRGYIRYPFIDPGAIYNGNVWDWDTYWSVYGLFSLWDWFDGALKRDVLIHAEGNVRNFFDHQLPDGYIPMMIVDQDDGMPDTYLNIRHQEGVRLNMHKPFLASQTLLVCRQKGDFMWAKAFAPGFRRYMAYYDTYFQERSGLYVWHDDIMIGMDNDPASFGRPENSTANIFLNAFMTCELRDLAELYQAWGMEEDAEKCLTRRTSLIRAIQEECWDRRDGFFYSVDVDIHTRPYDWFHKGLGVFWKTLPIKIRVWSGFIPLFAGIATPEQAESMRRHALDDQTFRCDYGVCTLAKDEKMFDLSATSNPSNWLGPVWLVANYVVARGLRNYGFHEEADEIARGSLRLLSQDLQQTGCLHEYYDPSTGRPVMNGGFINWNILALTMARESGLG